MSHLSLIKSISKLPATGYISGTNPSEVWHRSGTSTGEDLALVHESNVPRLGKGRDYYSVGSFSSTCSIPRPPYYIKQFDASVYSFRETLRKVMKRPRTLQKKVMKGSCFIILHQVRNNFSILVRTPSGKTLAAWRGGYGGTKRSTRMNLAEKVDMLVSMVVSCEFKYFHLQYSGTGSHLLYSVIFGLKEEKIKLKTVTLVTRLPHNGPRVKGMRRV
jgi:ribosomal protein S11